MKNEHDIFNTLKKERLSERERELLKSRLDEYRALKPLAQGAAAPTPPPFLFFPFMRPVPVFASLALLLVVGGGVAQAAEGALPGDLLYPIKTAVTEEVRFALAADSEAKVGVETWRAERRLLEAQELAARESLTDEAKDQLEKNFAKHADNAEAHLAVISEEDPVLAADLGVQFEASLIAHEAILSALDTQAQGSLKDSVKIRLKHITAARKVAARSATDEEAAITISVSARAEDSSSAAGDTGAKREMESVPATLNALPVDDQGTRRGPNDETEKIAARAAERTKKSAERALEKTEKRFNKKRDSFTADERAGIESQFADAKRLFAEGKQRMEEGAHRDAFNIFQEVTLSMNTLDVLLRTDINTNSRTRILHVDPTTVDPVEVHINGPIIQIDTPEVRIDIDLNRERDGGGTRSGSGESE